MNQPAMLRPTCDADLANEQYQRQHAIYTQAIGLLTLGVAREIPMGRA